MKQLSALLVLLTAACNKPEKHCETWSVMTANIIVDSNCGGNTFIHTDTSQFCDAAIPAGINEGDTINQRLSNNGCYNSFEVWLKRLK